MLKVSSNALTAEDVANELGVSKNTVYRLVREGALDSYSVGRKMRFTQADVESYMHSMHTTSRKGKTSPVDEEDRIDLGVPTSETSTPDYTIAGIDLATDMVAHHLNEEGFTIARSFINAYAGLIDLYSGKADLAVVDLYDRRTNSCNVPYAQRLAPGVPLIVMHLASREMGLIVRRDNPCKLSNWSSLVRKNPRLANRPRGCSERVLLDEKLISLEANPARIKGYDSIHPSTRSVAQAVSSGAADVAIGTAKTAGLAKDVSFIPLQTVNIDVVIASNAHTLPLIRHIKSMLASDEFRKELDSLGFENTGKAGSILYQC